MRGVKRIKTFLVLVLSICMVVTSLTPTDLTKILAADSTTTVYFLNTEGWTDVYGYSWSWYDSNNTAKHYNGEWPGVKATQVKGDWWKIDIPASSSETLGIKFSDGGDGANGVECHINNDDYLYITSSGKYATALEAENAMDKVPVCPYDSSVKVRDVFNGNNVKGNRIEAEVTNEYNGISHDGWDSNTNTFTGTSASGGGNIGGTSGGGRWAAYYLYFGRTATKMNIRYSLPNSDWGGRFKIYLDSLDTEAVGSISTSYTGSSWSSWADITGDVNIPAGYHVVYLYMDTDNGYTGNVDYFSFESPYDSAIGRHEAEKAHSTIIGAANDGNKIESAPEFSNGAAVKDLNSVISDNMPAYTSTYVRAYQAGLYTMKIGYANYVDVKFDYRINGDSWKRLSVAKTGGWNTVKEIEVTVALKKGINTVDITGAMKENNDNPDEWINIDYFELSKTNVNQYSIEAFPNRDTTLTGNRIEAEKITTSSRESEGTQGPRVYAPGSGFGSDDKCSASGYLGHTLNGSWAEYDMYFDRRTSQLNLRYSGNSTIGGSINLYLDDMSGTPIATIATEPTSDAWDWSIYKDVTVDAEIPDGNHKIYFKFIANSGKNYAANVDFFSFNYEPEVLNITHEAENAHAYSDDYSIESSKNFSEGEAIGGLNAGQNETVKYLTQYVDVPNDGLYSLVIGYANAGNQTNIDYRINGAADGDWNHIAAPNTTWWDNVKEVRAQVTLTKGINIIDISGACYDASRGGEQWVNIDYFKIEDENLAVGRPVTVNGVSGGNEAKNAVDGDSTTRWASNSSSGWIYVDLEGLYEIERVDVLFEAAYAKDFEIQFSRDEKTWVTTKTVTNFLNGENHDEDGKTSPLTWTSEDTCLGKARYVRVKANAMQQWHPNMSIWELKVYGTKVPGYLSDVAVDKTAAASSERTDRPAKIAVDGKDTTSWAADNNDVNPEYTIDLNKEYALSSIDFKFNGAYAKAFTVSVSNDGESWTELKKETDFTEPGNITSGTKLVGYSFHFDPVNARYVKLNVDERAKPSWGLALYEFEVWGQDKEKLDYWKEIGSKSMGVYPVSKLQDTKYENSISDTYPLGVIDSSLVTGDILMTDDTYEVIYDPNDRDIFFYANPRDINANYGEIAGEETQEVFWSNGNSGSSLWGASEHDENIAKYIAKQQATVQYQLPENLDFEGKDYVETEIGCRIYNTKDIENGVPKSGTKPIFSMKFKLKILNSHGIYIEDTLRENGCIHVKNADGTKSYVWEKSEDGKTWKTVSEKRKDVQIIKNNGSTVNVADDLGGGYYYRVKEVGGEWSQPYQIPYYNNVQNGDFEFPAMFSYDEETGESMATRFPFNSNGDEQQYPNGYEGMFWKTTGPGYYNTHNTHKTTHDIEIVNARNLRTDLEGNQQGGFSVSQKDMYGDNSHGDQFAELNCEEQGALYQDILTTPGSECYWDLDHAARMVSEGATNSMLVVAMSSKNALNYTKDTEIEKIIAASGNVTAAVSEEYKDGTVIKLENGVQATVWKVTSTTTKGEWKHNCGKYTVPVADENYLTRFFFVSIDGTGGNRTIGNLLDNVTFEQRKAYTIKYVVNGKEVYQTTGITDPYSRVDIPSSLPTSVVDTDGNYIDLTKYTLKESSIVKYQRDASGNILYESDGVTPKTTEESYYIDNNDRNLTVYYDHDTVIIYYESGIVTLTKRVVGLTSLPDDYTVKLKLMDGSTEKYSKTFSKSEFTLVDKADSSAPDSYFASVSFKSQEVSGGLTSGKTYTVTEEDVKPMIGTGAYLTQVTAGNTVNDIAISDLTKDTVSYSDTDFVYNTNADNSELFINTYKSTHKVTLSKKVTGNMGEKEKARKDFNFTVEIANGNTGVNAVMCDDTAITNSEAGKYEFDLKDSENISFIVYDGCTVTVTEEKAEWYSTTYDVKGVETSINKGAEVEDTSNPVTTTKAIYDDVDIICTNDSTDLGDVEVQGYQMNTDTSEGAPAEFSPSFRVVCRVSKNTIKRRKVVKAGVIFGTTKAVGTGMNAITNLTIPKAENLENNGTATSVKDGVDRKIADNIFYHEETEGGYYDEWTTKEDDAHPYTHWNYYALTFRGTSYMYGMLTQDLTYRAYAIVEGTAKDYDYEEDGKYYKYEYGNDIYTMNMYEIAENLYENQKMSTEAAHNFLYNNILNLVTMDKNRVQIANAMRTKLGITTKDHNYNLINACYKNMYDYIHCLSGYKYQERGTAVPNKDFVLKNYNVDGEIETYNTELLEKLNAASGTDYSSLSQWIYYETEKVENSKIPGIYYSGYYKMVPYEWNSGVVTDFDEDAE